MIKVGLALAQPEILMIKAILVEYLLCIIKIQNYFYSHSYFFQHLFVWQKLIICPTTLFMSVRLPVLVQLPGKA